MDHRGCLLLSTTLLFYFYTLNSVYAAFEPVCKRLSFGEDYNKFLVHLKLGYDNPDPSISQDLASTEKQIQLNTRCGIQTICLSIMRVTALNASNPFRFEKFEEISKDFLVILYNMNANYDRRILYPVWLFSLYVKNFGLYGKKFNDGQMKCVEEMIIKQLSESMQDCPGDNEFSLTDHSSSEMLQLFPGKIKKRLRLIRRNLRRVTTANKSYEQIDVDNLLFSYKNLYEVAYNFDRFMNAFGRYGEIWGDVSRKFSNAYHKATDPTSLYTALEGIKRYQSVVLTLLKMVVLRMVHIHLLLAVTDGNRQEVNAAMHETVTSFVDITGLQDDQTFAETLNFLQVQSPQQATNDALKKRILLNMMEISLKFPGCKVWQIVEKNIPQILTEAYMLENFPTVLKKNHGSAVIFVQQVKEWMGNADLDFIKSVLALSYPIPGNFPDQNLPPFFVDNTTYYDE